MVAPPRGRTTKHDPIDPYENINRKSYTFTDVIDRRIVAPVADAYIDYVPDRMQRIVGNFYDTAYPNVILNSFLQGKVRQGFQDTLRFAVNSTSAWLDSSIWLPPWVCRSTTKTSGRRWEYGCVDAKTYLVYSFARAQRNVMYQAFPSAYLRTVSFMSVFCDWRSRHGAAFHSWIVDKRARLSGPSGFATTARWSPTCLCGTLTCSSASI